MKRTVLAEKKSSASGTSTGAGKARRQAIPKFAVCIDNAGYPSSLELHKIYRVLPDREAFAEGDLRIVDESGEDYLYSRERFMPLELPKRLAALLNAEGAKRGRT